MAAWYIPAMMETKTHQTTSAARMRRMRQRRDRGALLVTLELKPDDLAALRVASPDHAGQAIFRLIDRLKGVRRPTTLPIPPRRVLGPGPAAGSTAIRGNPAGDTAASRHWPAAPGA